MKKTLHLQLDNSVILSISTTDLEDDEFCKIMILGRNTYLRVFRSLNELKEYIEERSK